MSEFDEVEKPGPSLRVDPPRYGALDGRSSPTAAEQEIYEGAMTPEPVI